MAPIKYHDPLLEDTAYNGSFFTDFSLLSMSCHCQVFLFEEISEKWFPIT